MLFVLEGLHARLKLFGGFVVELPQQGALPVGPGVPDHGRQVGIGKQVERLEPFHAGEEPGELGDHFVVVQVAALGDGHHVLVMLDQEENEAAVLVGKIQALQQLRGHLDPADDVVLAPGLADVVQEHREIEHVAAFQLGVDLLQVARLVRVGQGLQVVQGHQGVLVGGVQVVDVVLDQAGQGAELGKIGAQYAEVVHAAQGSRRAVFAPQDAHEDVARLGRPAQLVVDQVQGGADGALHLLAQAQFLDLCQVKDGKQPQGFVGEITLAPGQDDFAVYRHRARLQQDAPVADPPPGGQALEGQLDQVIDRAGVEIVVAHEALGGKLLTAVFVTQAEGDLGFEFMSENVAPAADVEVELVAHPPQEPAPPLQGLDVLAVQMAAPQGIHPGLPEVGFQGPFQGVDVAQPARALLDVRFEQLHRAVSSRASPAPLLQRRHHAPGHALVEAFLELFEQAPVAGQEAAVHHGGAGLHVVPQKPNRLGQGAAAVAQVEAHVPERVQHTGNEGGVLVLFLGEEKEEIDVGMRGHLLAPVSAQGHQ